MPDLIFRDQCSPWSGGIEAHLQMPPGNAGLIIAAISACRHAYRKPASYVLVGSPSPLLRAKSTMRPEKTRTRQWTRAGVSRRTE